MHAGCARCARSHTRSACNRTRCARCAREHCGCCCPSCGHCCASCARYERSRTPAQLRHRPNNPALSRHQRTMSRLQTSQPYCDRETFVLIDFSFTLKCHCCYTKSHVATPKAPTAKRPVVILKTPVAT